MWLNVPEQLLNGPDFCFWGQEWTFSLEGHGCFYFKLTDCCDYEGLLDGDQSQTVLSLCWAGRFPGFSRWFTRPGWLSKPSGVRQMKKETVSNLSLFPLLMDEPLNLFWKELSVLSRLKSCCDMFFAANVLAAFKSEGGEWLTASSSHGSSLQEQKGSD